MGLVMLWLGVGLLCGLVMLWLGVGLLCGASHAMARGRSIVWG